MKKIMLVLFAASLFTGCVRFKSPYGYEAEVDMRNDQVKATYADPAGNEVSVDTNQE